MMTIAEKILARASDSGAVMRYVARMRSIGYAALSASTWSGSAKM